MNKYYCESSLLKSISKRDRYFILKRCNKACQMCGMTSADCDPYRVGRKVTIEMRKIENDKSASPYNVWLICNVCREGLTQIRTRPARPKQIELLTQIRRATIEDQMVVLKWLQQKYGQLKKK